MLDVQIKEITKDDNTQIESVIRSAFIELNLPLKGTAYEDQPLKSHSQAVCELQKMYVLTKIRGCGIGQKLMDCCLDAARSFGFKKCYLETIPALHSAVDLYRRNDFLELQAPLGATGHHNCGIWMIKDLL